MKKMLILALVLVIAFGIYTPAGAWNMPENAVKAIQFPLSNMMKPNTIKYFNKVVDMGNGIKGKMVIGRDEKTFLDTWKPNTGKRDVYQWNGSRWVYLYSITDIVPGFEEPKTINSYKYATWDDYTHTVPTGGTDNPNPNPPSNALTVTLTGPTTRKVSQQGTYTAHVSGGTSPYHLTWSSDGYISASGHNANYKWDEKGKYTVIVNVTDLNGQSATAKLDVTVKDWEVHVTGPASTVLYYPCTSIDRDGTPSFSSNLHSTNGPYYIEITSPGKYKLQKLQIGNITEEYPNVYVTVVSGGEMIDIFGGTNYFHITSTDGGKCRIGLFDGLEGLRLGDTTITIAVQNLDDGSTKTASLPTHVDYAEMARSGFNAYTIQGGPDLTAPAYAYTVLAQRISTDDKGKATVTVYKKTITSTMHYSDMKAFNEAAQNPATDIGQQISQFRSNPGLYANGTAQETGDAKDAGSLQQNTVSKLIDTSNSQNTLQYRTYSDSLKNNSGGNLNLSFGTTEATATKNKDGTNTYAPVCQEEEIDVGEPPTVRDSYLYLSTNPDLSPYYNAIIYTKDDGDLDPDTGQWETSWEGTTNITENTSFSSPISIKLPEDLIIKPAGDEYSYVILSKKDVPFTESINPSFTQTFSGTSINLNLEVDPVGDGKHAFIKSFPVESSLGNYTENLRVTLNDGKWVYAATWNKVTTLPYEYSIKYSPSEIPPNRIVPFPSYTIGPSKIIGIFALPESSFTFNSIKPQSTMIFYKLSDGSADTVTGSQYGILESSGGNGGGHHHGGDDGGEGSNKKKQIALWYRRNELLTIVPLHKGSGVIHFSKSDLGGPYGVDIPITVNVDVGDFNITVNNRNWESLKDYDWLGSDSYRDAPYAYGIDSHSCWWTTKYNAGVLQSVGMYGTKNWYKTSDKSSLSAAANAVSMYNLKVYIETPSSIKVRFTVQYGDSDPIVMDTNGTKNLQNRAWVVSMLEKAYQLTFDWEHYDESVTYKIEISIDDGQSWIPIKSGQDVIHFQKGFN